MAAELTKPLHKKLYRLLQSGWMDRYELSEKMFLSEPQVTAMLTVFRGKNIIVETRPHPDIIRKKQFKIGTGEDAGRYVPQSPRSIRASNDLLMVEINRIRIEAERLKITSIEQIARKALQACGLATQSTRFD